MACYEGETLKEKIERGRCRSSEALDYASQIGAGLAKAHAAGIVHRDIKPANVIVTRGRAVKILDFGIAKLLGDGDADPDRHDTRHARLHVARAARTAGASTPATDIWSLGVVLYEMIAGQLPFNAAHLQAVAVAIEQRTPEPLSSLRWGLPIDLNRIVGRALAKSPADRFQSVSDFLSELRRLTPDVANAPSAATTLTPARQSHQWSSGTRRLSAGIAVLLLAAVILFAMSRRGEDRLPRLTSPAQVAASIGEERLPSWSSDGRMLAFQSDQTGNNDIWITQIGGTAINRTADFTGGDEVPRLSPDGRQIAFWSAREGAGVFLMSALGGSPRKIAPGRRDVAAAAAWSPDGKTLVYPIVNPIATEQRRLEILEIQSGNVRRVALGATLGDPQRPGGAIDIAWSPNGRFLAVLSANSYNNQTSRIWTLRLNDEKWTAVTAASEINWSPSWSPDNRSLLFTSNRGGTDGPVAATAHRHRRAIWSAGSNDHRARRAAGRAHGGWHAGRLLEGPPSGQRLARADPVRSTGIVVGREAGHDRPAVHRGIRSLPGRATARAGVGPRRARRHLDLAGGWRRAATGDGRSHAGLVAGVVA